MKRSKRLLALSNGMMVLIVLWVTLIAFLLPTPAAADNCLDDITNLADCMRTPFVREAITITAGLLGVTPLVLVHFLSSLGAQNPFSGLISNIASGPLGSLFVRLWDQIKPLINDISPNLVKSIERSIARNAGANLAERTSDILDALNKPPSSSTPPTPPAKPPVGLQPSAGGASGGSGGSGTTGGSGTSGGPGGTGAAGGAASPPGRQYTGPVVDHDTVIFDSNDAHRILQALGLIPPTVPPDGSVPVTRSGLDNLLGQHPSSNPIEITLDNGRTVIVTSVQGIAFDSGDGPPGGDPGLLDFTKGVAIAAQVVEPAPPPRAPAPAAPPTPGPTPGAPPAPGPGPGGTPPGGPTGGQTPQPGGPGTPGQSTPDTPELGELLGQQPGSTPTPAEPTPGSSTPQEPPPGPSTPSTPDTPNFDDLPVQPGDQAQTPGGQPQPSTGGAPEATPDLQGSGGPARPSTPDTPAPAQPGDQAQTPGGQPTADPSSGNAPQVTPEQQAGSGQPASPTSETPTPAQPGDPGPQPGGQPSGDPASGAPGQDVPDAQIGGEPADAAAPDAVELDNLLGQRADEVRLPGEHPSAGGAQGGNIPSGDEGSQGAILDGDAPSATDDF